MALKIFGNNMFVLESLIYGIVFLGSVYALLALGFAITYNLNKFFDISYAVYLLLGGYAYLFLNSVTIWPLISLILSIVFTAMVSLGIEIFLYARLRRKNASIMVYMVMSLGVLMITQSIISIIFTSDVQVLPSLGKGVAIGEMYFPSHYIIALLAMLFLCSFSIFIYKKTRLGLKLRAIFNNEELAVSAGIKVDTIRILVTPFVAGIAALAGILIGMENTINPNFGLLLMLKAVICGMIFGLGNVSLVVLGALTLATLEISSIWYIGGQWKDAVSFAFLVAVLVAKNKLNKE